MKMSTALLASLFASAMALPGAAWSQSAAPGAAPAAAGDKAAAPADNAAAVAAATESVTRWLALADAGNWSESWDQMAPASQAVGTKPVFTGAMSAARAQLGAVKARKLRSAVFTRSLPGAPAGEYVLVQYDSQFANQAAAVETLVPMRTPDGSWKVSGYNVR